MTPSGFLQIGLYFVALGLCVQPIGRFMAGI